jgi:hypothetical protein
MIGQVSSRPSCSVMNKMHLSNSVNPKLYEHGNTELNVGQPTKCVENRRKASVTDEGMFRTYGKPYEVSRNEILTHYMSGNRLCDADDGRRHRYDIISGCTRDRYLFVLEHIGVEFDRGDAHMRNSGYRGCSGNHHPTVYPHR